MFWLGFIKIRKDFKNPARSKSTHLAGGGGGGYSISANSNHAGWGRES
jgi:hypothetical protein